MTKPFGISMEELIAQLNTNDEREVMDPGEDAKIDELCFFEPRILKPEEVRERARKYLEIIVQHPNSSYSMKERKRGAQAIGYTGKLEVNHYVRNMIIKARLKEVAEIAGGLAMWGAAIAGGALAGYYFAKITH